MTKRKKNPKAIPSFANYEEEAAWWDKHGPALDDDCAEWEELEMSPDARVTFEKGLVTAFIRAAVETTGRVLAPGESPGRLHELAKQVAIGFGLEHPPLGRSSQVAGVAQRALRRALKRRRPQRSR